MTIKTASPSNIQGNITILQHIVNDEYRVEVADQAAMIDMARNLFGADPAATIMIGKTIIGRDMFLTKFGQS